MYRQLSSTLYMYYDDSHAIVNCYTDSGRRWIMIGRDGSVIRWLEDKEMGDIIHALG